MYEMKGFSQHFICGPWGCGPWGCGPLTNALLAIDIGWATAIWPPLLYLPWRLRFAERAVNRTAFGLIAVGLTEMIAVSAWQWFVWLPHASEWAQKYIWQRCGFTILTAGDWPIMQSFIGGFLLLASRHLQTHVPDQS